MAKSFVWFVGAGAKALARAAPRPCLAFAPGLESGTAVTQPSGEAPPPSLESLFQRHLPRLVAFIRARAGRAVALRESANDLAQSVCREVLADLEGFEYRGDEAFRGYLFQQATRKILDRSRYLQRERRDVGREQASPPGDADAGALLEAYATLCTPSRHAAARDELQRIESAVAALPDAQREAVAMSRLMGLSYAEVAAALECSESAARGLVARGLAALTAKLGEP
jgi:RNA polymerase sigma-70 factor (ECF subfamily)